MRAGTENIYGIVGFAKALEIATENYKTDSTYIGSLKYYMMDELFGNPNSNIESVYYYIFPYILEYIDDYLDKVYIRHKPFAIYPILYNHI